MDLSFFGAAASEDDRYVFTDDFQIAQDTGYAVLLTDAAGENTVNAAALRADLFLTTNAGQTATADGQTLYRLADNTILHALIAGDGNDTLTGSARDELLESGRGNDEVSSAGGDDTVRAGDGDDTIEGLSGDSSYFGEAGNDSINARGGNDEIFGGDGSDTISAGSGNDTVFGGNGRDQVSLNDGNDLFIDNAQGGELGRDTVFAGNGDDTIEGGNSADIFFGDAGNDLIMARLGNDEVFAGSGNDQVFAGSGNDEVFGGNGFDRISTHDGNDTVRAGNGQDRIFLGAGDDAYIDTAQSGVLGQDTINGGTGADIFVFDVGTSDDVIVDFEVGVDMLAFGSLLLGTRTAQEFVTEFTSTMDDEVVFDFGDGQSVTLLGVASTAGLEDGLSFF